MTKKLSEYRLASKSEIEELLHPPIRLTRLHGGGLLSGYGEVHSTKIYMIIHKTFGKPNIEAEKGSSWEWIFKTPKDLLSVFDSKGMWAIGYRGLKTKVSQELKNEATQLRDVLIKEAKKISFSKKQIEKYKVGGAVLNPYASHQYLTEELMKQAKQLNEEIETLMSEGGSFLEVFKKSNTVEALYRATFMTIFLSLEGFINLVYTLFLKDRYRKKLYERRLKREQFPIRILEIDAYCHSFEQQPLKMQDELFKAIHYLIDRRNSFVHANISDTTESNLIKIEDYLVVESGRVIEEKYGIPSDLSNLKKFHVIRANRLVKKLVVKVLRAMCKDTRYLFTLAHSNLWVEYRREKPDETYFPLNAADSIYFPENGDLRVSDDFVTSVLKESVELDTDYYDIDEYEDFKPMFNHLGR